MLGGKTMFGGCMFGGSGCPCCGNECDKCYKEDEEVE